MTKNPKLDPLLQQERPWLKNENHVWLASTIGLHRNIEKFPFPAKLDIDRKRQITSLVSKEVLQSNFLTKPILIKSEEINPVEKQFLMEHFLTLDGFQQAYGGEAFVLDENGEFFTIINVGDHVQFHLIDCQGELENAWNQVVKIETQIGQLVNYAFSRFFGFLTADPTHSGTGLIVSIFLQPSALIHMGKIQDVRDRLATDSVTITGIQGGKDIIGDVLVIRNNYSLGLTEENIISSLRVFTTKLIVEESSARSILRQEENEEMKDKVSRAYGVLVHSYKIDVVESLNAISLLKLGADLGWLKGVTAAQLNQLFFNCRRGHLLSRFDEEPTQEEIPHRRAEFIHKVLKDVALTI